ncbi:ABC transporter ATP-binding protein [Desmospora profundinema]|uniref:ABC transport system ATP-binding protein n=1 Tax=Desmospora profundinema TaxID=1571184 RepID=A0ABU1IRF7_9BACL|nr:ABC transporter ATP-binding protein [Desmospora profundinema]MDR6227013.1 putative ABC transport system ATP-binding protein [Desmospora profundinema]
MILLEGIDKTYGTGSIAVTVLRNIHLEVGRGEFVAIMGPSGSGKSTLMNLIGCLDRPDCGTVRLDGMEVSQASEGQLATLRNRTIGFVFQNFQLLPRMNALRNVELPLVYAGAAKRERMKRSREALERVGLSDRVEHFPAELSGGQQQRVAIARALVNRPKLLLADEPTGALDTRSGETVLALFRELHKEGKTVVMITHDPEVARHADRQVRIRDGEIVEDTAWRRGGA